MDEFINWASLATYGGALTMVLLLTQFTKDLPFTKKMPTQIWSYILSLFVLVLANAFTSGLNAEIAAGALFNAAIISLAANGGYSAITKNKNDGQLLIDTSDSEKDIYRLALDKDPGEFINKKSITLEIKPNVDLSQK